MIQGTCRVWWEPRPSGEPRIHLEPLPFCTFTSSNITALGFGSSAKAPNTSHLYILSLKLPRQEVSEAKLWHRILNLNKGTEMDNERVSSLICINGARYRFYLDAPGIRNTIRSQVLQRHFGVLWKITLTIQWHKEILSCESDEKMLLWL